MKRIPKMQILVWVLAIVPIILTAVFYPRLPASILMQWDFGGEVGYEPKWHLFIIAALAPLFAVLFPLMSKIDLRRKSYDKFAPSYLLFQAMMMLFVILMVGIVLIESLRPGSVRIGRTICLFLGVLFAVIGNMMPKFRQNYFCGIKTPWTYADEVVWTRTHRLAGRLMFAAGLLGIVSAFLPGDVLMAIVFFVPLIISVVVPVLMSYIWYRQRHPQN